MHTKLEIRNLIVAFRERFNLQFPLNIEKLEKFAEDLNTIILYRDIDAEGYFINNGEKLVIILKEKAINNQRQLFTLAHEIGHRILHINSTLLQRHQESVSSINRYEIKTIEDEANYFASELLLPTNMLKNILPNKSITQNLIEKIASKSNISYHAAAIKCIENSKTENELLLFFEKYDELKWFCSADISFEYKHLPQNLDVLEYFLEKNYLKSNIEKYFVENYGTTILISGIKKGEYDY